MNEQATRAQTSQGSERRRTPRVALDLLIQYRFESYEAFLGDRSLDISAGGIFICTEAPREEGTLVYLQFRLKEGAPLVEGLGRVVRVNPPGVPGRVAGMGVEFVNLDDESRQTIEDIVTRRLSKAHR